MEILTENRCSNKAMMSGNDLFYIVGKGEVRWECYVVHEDSRELRKYGLQLEDTFVHCPSLAEGDCRAGFKLKKISDAMSD